MTAHNYTRFSVSQVYQLGDPSANAIARELVARAQQPQPVAPAKRPAPDTRQPVVRPKTVQEDMADMRATITALMREIVEGQRPRKHRYTMMGRADTFVVAPCSRR